MRRFCAYLFFRHAIVAIINARSIYMTEKKRLAGWKILLIVIASVIVFILLFMLGVRAYFRLPVGDYYKASEKTFVIPGTNGGYIAQGIEYDSENDRFLCTGYMNKGGASPLYVVDAKENKLIKSLKLANVDGSEYTGHAGGLALHGNKIYVADGKGLLVYDYSEVMNAQDGSLLTAKSRFSSQLNDDDYVKASFVVSSQEGIWIGEFHREGNYNTLDSHDVTLSDGSKNCGLAVLFPYDGENDTGLKEKPIKAFSLPDLVQGMCFYNGNVFISTSYGPAFSHISVYKEENLIKNTDEYQVLGAKIPLYVLSSESMTSSKKIAPMSEEIVTRNGKLYVMCESASDKYIFGKFTSSKYCYATDIEKFFG